MSCSNFVENSVENSAGSNNKADGVHNTFESQKRSSKMRKLAPSLHGLKKIARLLKADMLALIRALKKLRHSKRSRMKGTSCKNNSGNKNGVSLSTGSGPSVNSKDWKNWEVLHGKAVDVALDVVEMGEVIGIKCSNSFQVLDRRGVGGEARVTEVSEEGMV